MALSSPFGLATVLPERVPDPEVEAVFICKRLDIMFLISLANIIHPFNILQLIQMKVLIRLGCGLVGLFLVKIWATVKALRLTKSILIVLHIRLSKTWPLPTVESTSGDDQNRNSSSSKNGESTDSILSKHAVKFMKAAERSTTNKVETAKKPSMRYVELYRKPSKKPNVRGNQRNWNNLKSHQLGTKDATSQEVKKDVSSLRYIALPNWAHDALLEFFSSTPNSDESNGEEADISNMETIITASPTPTLRIHKDHPKS
nr:hypothetical protein [Tanacetum cinerariifolium]